MSAQPATHRFSKVTAFSPRCLHDSSRIAKSQHSTYRYPHGHIKTANMLPSSTPVSIPDSSSCVVKDHGIESRTQYRIRGLCRNQPNIHNTDVCYFDDTGQQQPRTMNRYPRAPPVCQYKLGTPRGILTRSLIRPLIYTFNTITMKHSRNDDSFNHHGVSKSRPCVRTKAVQ